MAIAISDARMISHAPRVECLEVTIPPPTTGIFLILAGFCRDAKRIAFALAAKLQSLRRIPRLPAVDTLAVAPEIFLRLYTGAAREVIAHQRQGVGNCRRAHAVGPVAAEHDAIFT